MGRARAVENSRRMGRETRRGYLESDEEAAGAFAVVGPAV